MVNKYLGMGKSAKKAIILALLPMFFLFAVPLTVSLINGIFSVHDCFQRTECLNTQYSGQIVNKGNDYSNHCYPYFTVADSDQVETKHMFSGIHAEKFIWPKLEIGDTIEKHLNSLDFRIKRNGQTFIYSESFECTEDDFYLRLYE
mgnify:FL=1